MFTERLDDETGTIRGLWQMRDEIQLDPDYQRDSDIWDRARRQLLIDSILNGFDIPKLYFRSFVPRVVVGDRAFRYAVIDGKQRLEAIWAFLDNKFTLGSAQSQVPELQDLTNRELDGLTFRRLLQDFPDLAERVLDFRLDVVTIETSDEEVIEDMFLRLNEASPLNAAEKRNAFGGPLPAVARALSTESYFSHNLPFPNRRFRYQEIATKFLYFEHRQGVASTKKPYLDRFASEAGQLDDFGRLQAQVSLVLTKMHELFEKGDSLLRAAGMSSVYYLFVRQALAEKFIDSVDRAFFVQFESDREQNKQIAQDDEATADYDLLEFGRLAQSPNDAVAVEFRCNVLLSRLGQPPLPERH
ncbi:DUF262 domain-containing protein [Nocardioides korecus]